MFSAIISVRVAGPPAVRDRFWSNILKESEIDKNNPMANAGATNGSPKPTALMQITEQIANTKVNRNEFQNLLSLNNFP